MGGANGWECTNRVDTVFHHEIDVVLCDPSIPVLLERCVRVTLTEPRSQAVLVVDTLRTVATEPIAALEMHRIRTWSGVIAGSCIP